MAKRRFPAEWEEQQAILLCFPHNGHDWPGKYQAIQWAFVELIKKISRHEHIILVVKDVKLKEKVSSMLTTADVDVTKTGFIIQKTNRSWMRDSGPIIVKKGDQREALKFTFNGWAKYTNYTLDRHVAEAVSAHLGIPLTTVLYKGQEVVLEGGAIEVNGQGTLITSEECLLDPDIQVRNPGFTKADYEAIFYEYLGITHTIWLKDGITGDDTHGHIDDLCRFVNVDTVVTVMTDDPGDDNYHALNENLSRLKRSVTQDGKQLRVITLPMPEKIVFDGVILPASYANFLILNHCVLVPTFNDVSDRAALQTLQTCFPDREVIGISAIDLIWGFGTLHCLSQQIPL